MYFRERDTLIHFENITKCISLRPHTRQPQLRDATSEPQSRWIMPLYMALEYPISHLLLPVRPPGRSLDSTNQISDRLPTVSVAAALQDLKCSPTRYVSTGLRDLDAVLQNRDPTTIQEGEVFHGGVSKGKVTEIYGPPGVGKTALG